MDTRPSAGELDGFIRKPDIQNKAHGLQAHRAFSGAGNKLGLVLRAYKIGWQTRKGTESLCVYGRRDSSRGCRRCHGVSCRCGMVQTAKENATLSGLSDASIRYIIDDCKKFIEREIRRGNRYDAIIMDPPSYGRGPTGEVWKIEDNIDDLVLLTQGVLSDKPLFFLLNSYTTGLSASAMKYITDVRLVRKFGGKSEADEIGLPVSDTGLVLPCGSSVRVVF